jgi:hypothetical protein
MSTTLVDRVTDGIVKIVKQPVRVASYGVGLARGLASSVLRAASGTGGPAHAEWVAPPEPLTDEALEHQDEAPTPLYPQAAPPRRPGAPGEAFATEPTAVTRDSAHGGSGRGADADIDDWYGSVDDTEEAGPGGVVEALEFGDRLTPVEADIKAILSDADLLRRAGRRPDERD